VSEFVIVPFDSQRHTPFVFDTFRKSVGEQWPWSAMPRRVLDDDLRRQLILGRALVAVAADDDDNFLGWTVCRPELNQVVFGFVKYLYRQRFSIGSSLVLAAGVDLTRPTLVRYWTRAAERISSKPGYQLRFTVLGELPEAA
jgi:hypothetical protein